MCYQDVGIPVEEVVKQLLHAQPISIVGNISKNVTKNMLQAKISRCYQIIIIIAVTKIAVGKYFNYGNTLQRVSFLARNIALLHQNNL